MTELIVPKLTNSAHLMEYSENDNTFMHCVYVHPQGLLKVLL